MKRAIKFPKPKAQKGRGCRISLRDEDLKRARGYKHPSSFVRKDGTEVLKGQDWVKRKKEVFERCGWQCEYTVGGIRCREDATDAHHVIARSRYRMDNLNNLEGLCRKHHSLIDPRQVRPGERGE